MLVYTASSQRKLTLNVTQ